MRSNNRGWLIVGGASLFLASCGGADQGRAPPAVAPRPVGSGTVGSATVQDEPVRIGPPYQVGGVTYTPEDAPNYDEVGYATWYGEELSGSDTASGEPFVATGVTAAHKTLPLPSYVEVTALDSGRTILVRVNDRGPFTNDKIIDLSRGAAEQLGVIGDGAVPVRVRRVNPPEQERAVLRAHGQAAARLDTPASLLKALQGRLGKRPVATLAASSRPPVAAKPGPKPKPKPGLTAVSPPVRGPDMRESRPDKPGVDFVVEEPGARRPAPPVTAHPAPAPVPAPVPPSSSARGGYVVQVAAFASQNRAETLARRIGAKAVEGGGLWRVRFGPYPTQAAAQAGVKAAASGGFENARIMANDAR